MIKKDIAPGTEYQLSFSFSQEDVVKFSEASGDHNPIHLDATYAKETIFKKPIIHGFLGSSIFSRVFGTLFPGEGTIYLKQELSFLRPMYAAVDYIAYFKVLEVIPEKHRALVQTQIRDGRDKLITTGEALIQHHGIGRYSDVS